MSNTILIQILTFFPSLYDNNILNLYSEIQYAYKFHPFPLKNNINEYNYNTLKDLNQLRNYISILNEKGDTNQILIEIFKLYKYWGPDGFNILNNNLNNLISELYNKLQIEQEIMLQQSKIAAEIESENLDKELKKLSLNRDKKTLKDIDFSKLNINKFGSKKLNTRFTSKSKFY
jgi:hypothetical protein